MRERVSALTVPHITTCALDWKRTLTRYLEQHSANPIRSIAEQYTVLAKSEFDCRAAVPSPDPGTRGLQGLIAFLSPFARIPTATHAFVAMHLSMTPAR